MYLQSKIRIQILSKTFQVFFFFKIESHYVDQAVLSSQKDPSAIVIQVLGIKTNTLKPDFENFIYLFITFITIRSFSLIHLIL